MTYFDTEYPRIQVKATTLKQASYFFKSTYGYIPNVISMNHPSFKNDPKHLAMAKLHEKEMR